MKIEKLDETKPDALYCRYQGQSQPQDAYIEIDWREETIRADFNAEIGNAVPFAVWHGLRTRYGVPCGALPKGINELMDEFLPIVQEVAERYEEKWDGSSWVGGFRNDSEDDPVSLALDCWVEDRARHLPCLEVWDASDWFESIRFEHVRDVLAGKRTLDDIRDECEEETVSPDGNALRLNNIDCYLESLAEEIVNEREELADGEE